MSPCGIPSRQSYPAGRADCRRAFRRPRFRRAARRAGRRRARARPRGHGHPCSPRPVRQRGPVGAGLRRALRRIAHRLRGSPRRRRPATARESRGARAPRAIRRARRRRARHGRGVVALAHHRNDQAETLLLQLLRGSGPHGLAAMPALREDADDLAWWRPLLDVPRARIDAYAIDRNLRWCDDESNADHRHARNAVRHSVLPALVADRAQCRRHAGARSRAPGRRRAPPRRTGAAGRAGRIRWRLLRRAVFDTLSPHRARNLLRWFLRDQGLPAPSTARLAAMLDQLRGARGDAVIRLAHAGVEIGVHQGRIALHAAPPTSFDVRWRGEPELALPHGTLEFGHAEGAGIDLARFDGEVRVRSRAGGERFQVASGPAPSCAEVGAARRRDSALGAPRPAAGLLRRRAGRGGRPGNRRRGACGARATRPDDRLASKVGLIQRNNTAAACR